MGAGSFSSAQVFCLFAALGSDAEGSSRAAREDGNPQGKEGVLSGGDVGVKILSVVGRSYLIGLFIARIEASLGTLAPINGIARFASARRMVR